jgi:2-polyprenyl-6-methoxyphenol hydroxylase-like FAD-dependent oxidoreductase
VGGGLGGAAVALALSRKGFRVRLIEQAPEFGVIGYGIQLGPNAFHMFDRLGVSEAVLTQAIIPNSLLMLDSVDGGIIARIPTGESFMAGLSVRTLSFIGSICTASYSTLAR